MTNMEIDLDGARGVKCPTCRAPVGQSCVWNDGEGGDAVDNAHVARTGAATRAVTWGVYQGPEQREAHAAELADVGGYPNASTDVIALISCSSKKLDRAARARDLYTSALFR